MSSFFDNFMGGFAFGMLANNPFYRGMGFGGCCSGLGIGFGFGGINSTYYSGFANPFPSIFPPMQGSGGMSVDPILTEFANPQFPTVDFKGTCQTIWDTFTNPDSDYNKRMREAYKEYEKQLKENKSFDNKQYIPQMQFPFSSFYMPTQITMNPWVTGWFSQKPEEKKPEEKNDKEVKINTDNKDKKTSTNKYDDKRFNKFLSIVLNREGGYSNEESDRGGETLKGVTHTTYDEYRKSKGLPTQSVTKMTDDEMQEIYYKMFYKASGADSIPDKKLALYVFDTAVNMGVETAKNMFEASGGDINKFESLRKNRYKRIIENDDKQKANEEGWNNRMAAIKKAANNELNAIA